jgi:hypothetical protein
MHFCAMVGNQQVCVLESSYLHISQVIRYPNGYFTQVSSVSTGIFSKIVAVDRLELTVSVSWLSLWSPELILRISLVKFMVDRVAMGQVFLQTIQFPHTYCQ